MAAGQPVRPSQGATPNSSLLSSTWVENSDARLPARDRRKSAFHAGHSGGGTLPRVNKIEVRTPTHVRLTKGRGSTGNVAARMETARRVSTLLRQHPAQQQVDQDRGMNASNAIASWRKRVRPFRMALRSGSTQILPGEETWRVWRHRPDCGRAFFPTYLCRRRDQTCSRRHQGAEFAC